jgi:superfamily II DNA helicase RecQ
MTATATPSMRKYIHNCLRMKVPTSLVELSVDRTNVIIATAPIQQGRSSFKDLEWLIPDGTTSPESIRKAIIYLDSREHIQQLRTFLERRLSIPVRRRHVVLDYSTSISVEWREQIIMERFRTGDTRILICTDAAGMGLDIPDIEIVIQW